MEYVKNYHDQSIIWEKEYEKQLLVYYGILLVELNEIKHLTKQKIDLTILAWQNKYKKEIEQINQEYVIKLDIFSNKVVPVNEPITLQKDKIDVLASNNDQMLNITTEYIRNKFTELSILENGYSYSPVLADQMLKQIASNVEEKLGLFATMSTIGNLRELIMSNASRQGWTEYYWHTQRDSRVRPSHAAMDGKWFRMDDPAPKPLGMQPGEDYNCRCWMADFR